MDSQKKKHTNEIATKLMLTIYINVEVIQYIKREKRVDKV